MCHLLWRSQSGFRRRLTKEKQEKKQRSLDEGVPRVANGPLQPRNAALHRQRLMQVTRPHHRGEFMWLQ